MKRITVWLENIRISINAIRSNLLRTILTIIIIAFGIMALVGILTAIDAIKSTISQQFTMMGANSFSIVNRTKYLSSGNDISATYYRSIEYREAMEFKQRFDFPAKVSISTMASGTATIKYQSEKTNPNITVQGTDENFLATSGYTLAKGRVFTEREIRGNSHTAIIGSKLATTLFRNEDPLDKIISIGSGKYKVIGVLEEKGSSFGMSDDNSCFIPISSVRQYFGRPNMAFSIQGVPTRPEQLQAAINEAEGIFRIVRGLKPGEESNFSVETSDSLSGLMIDNLKNVTLAATIIGIITLFGAAIGLMNIMLVSVTERTREIGIRKAIGAKSITIRQQFLFESVIIGQLGGIFGIILGILIGNVVSLIVGGSFIIPWAWILGGVALCFLVSIGSGLFPAIKAAKLDPIVSLRYE